MKRIAAVLLMLTIIVSLAACSKNADVSPSPEEDVSAPPTVPAVPSPTEEVPPAAPLFINPLTGEALESEEELGRRPVAIMLNNLKKALPMSGVSEADIIYEVLAEGGITRMLGVYYNPDALEKIGTVRSARTYYLELALGHDALFIHAGASYLAYDEIKAWGMTTLDYVRGGSYASLMAWRDPDRVKSAGSEHSVYTSGERLLSAIAKVGEDMTAKEGYNLGWNFVKDSVPAGGKAETVEAFFTKKKKTMFEYKDNLYFVNEYDEEFIDENTGAQVSVNNVLCLHTDVAAIPGDTAGRLTVRLTGEGRGYWASGGKYIPIKWSKKDRNSPFVFTDESGKAITLAVGKSYICVVPENLEVNFS